ncbi:MAG: sugar ABC transporter substrate-binding protein [Anaerocolumna sp.]
MNGKLLVEGDKMLRSKILIGVIVCMTFVSSCTQINPGSKVLNKSAAASEKPVVIAFAHKSFNSYFYTIMNEAVKKAVEERGWIFENSVADYDPMRQNQQIVNFIEQSPDAIITTAIDSISIEEVIRRGNDAGIPMCTIDTNAVGGKLAIDVSFDNYKAGQMAAESIVEQLIKKYGEAKGTVFNAYGELSSNAWRLRKEGFESVINRYPNITYMARATEGRPELVKEELLKVFESGIQIDAVHASSEHPGRGLVEALQESDHWFPFWEDGHVILVTIDAEPYFVDLINKGYADSAVAQDVIAYGNITVDLLASYILAGKDIPEGKYYSEDTYWQVCDITIKDNQAKVTIPPYIINADSSNDHRQWSYIAEKVWGFQYNK